MLWTSCDPLERQLYFKNKLLLASSGDKIAIVWYFVAVCRKVSKNIYLEYQKWWCFTKEWGGMHSQMLSEKLLAVNIT